MPELLGAFIVTIARRIPVDPVNSSLVNVVAAALALVILVPLILPELSITKTTSVVVGMFFPCVKTFIFHLPRVEVDCAVFSICTAPGFGHSKIGTAETFELTEVFFVSLALVFS